MAYRHIKYRATYDVITQRVKVVILEQTEVRYDFNPDDKYEGDVFYASNGWELRSCDCPDYEDDDCEYVYMRGTTVERDFDEIDMPVYAYEKFKEAVLEYNEAFKD